MTTMTENQRLADDYLELIKTDESGLYPSTPSVLVRNELELAELHDALSEATARAALGDDNLPFEPDIYEQAAEVIYDLSIELNHWSHAPIGYDELVVSRVVRSLRLTVPNGPAVCPRMLLRAAELKVNNLRVRRKQGEKRDMDRVQQQLKF